MTNQPRLDNSGGRNLRPRWPLAIAAMLAGTALLGGGVLSSLAGCEKKPEPKKVVEEPPPQPPAPPPPPPRVDFASLGRELGVSPKLSFSPTLAVADAGFARAALRFADAMVKGDEKALSAMMGPRARSVLEDLASDGRFKSATDEVENIHLIYADVPLAPNMERTAALAAMSERVNELRDRAIAEARARGASVADANRVGAEVYQRELARMQSFAYDDAGSGFEGTPPSKVLVMAVQRIDGSYLLGWAAAGGGDAWTFESASTVSMTRARAEQWEDIGPAAFSLSTGKAPTKPSTTPAPAPDASPNPAGPTPAPAGPAPAGPAPAAPMTPGTPISPIG